MHYAWERTCELNIMDLLFVYYEWHVVNAVYYFYIC